MAGRQGKLIESKHSVEEICEILTRFGGLVYPAVRHIGVSRNALVKYIERYPRCEKGNGAWSGTDH